MTRILSLLFLFTTSVHAQPVLGPEAAPKAKPAFAYPPAERQPIVEQLFGMSVADPYRWLEDGKDPKVRSWAEAEDKLTRGELARAPGREALKKRIKQLLYIDDVSVPVRRGGRLFFQRTAATAEKPVVYVRGPAGKERLLLDPLQLAPDGTLTIPRWSPSFDGKFLLYTRNPNNADQGSAWVRDASTGKDLPEHIDGVDYGEAFWNPDSTGFWYLKFPTDPKIPGNERTAHAEVRYHALGTDPAKDRMEHPATASSEKWPMAWVSRDGHWLFFAIEHDSHEDDVWVRDLKKAGSTFQPLVLGLHAFTEVEAYHDRFYIKTNAGASRGRVLVMEPGKSGLENAREIVPEDPSALLESAQILGGKLMLGWLRNAASELEVRELDGKLLRKLPLPPLASAGSLSGDQDSDEMFFGVTTFTQPFQVFQSSVATGKSEVWAELKVPIDVTPYVAEQVWYPSKDGTRVSMFIVRRKDLKRDGSTPFLLEGYGGFAINWTPYFAVGAFIESGGALAIPNLRGGGEYGEEWHKAGTREGKQKVFDDFIAAGEYLVKERYTRPSRLAIMGGSNGGLLTGAVATQRPELFGAVICQVPLLDMLRYHRFGIAKLWDHEFGTPEVEADFKILAQYSPYHHVRATRYPAMMFFSSADDDRVDPLHARKMVAALQAANTGKRPIFLRVESHAGHGGADARAADVEEAADRSLFLFHQLGFPKRAGIPWL